MALHLGFLISKQNLKILVEIPTSMELGFHPLFRSWTVLLSVNKTIYQKNVVAFPPPVQEDVTYSSELGATGCRLPFFSYTTVRKETQELDSAWAYAGGRIIDDEKTSRGILHWWKAAATTPFPGCPQKSSGTPNVRNCWEEEWLRWQVVVPSQLFPHQSLHWWYFNGAPDRN